MIARSGLDTWGSISAIVAAAIAVLIFFGGIGRWIWDRRQRPKLVIECGDGFDFDKVIGEGDAFVAAASKGQDYAGAVGKFIRVREVNGRAGARSVVVRVKDVDPPPPHTAASVELRWAEHSETTDIRPLGHKSAILCLLIFYAPVGRPGWRGYPTLFEHAPEVRFTLELIVDGRPYSETRFKMRNTWAADEINLWEDIPWPPEEIDFPEATPLN